MAFSSSAASNGHSKPSIHEVSEVNGASILFDSSEPPLLFRNSSDKMSAERSQALPSGKLAHTGGISSQKELGLIEDLKNVGRYRHSSDSPLKPQKHIVGAASRGPTLGAKHAPISGSSVLSSLAKAPGTSLLNGHLTEIQESSNFEALPESLPPVAFLGAYPNSVSMSDSMQKVNAEDKNNLLMQTKSDASRSEGKMEGFEFSSAAVPNSRNSGVKAPTDDRKYKKRTRYDSTPPNPRYKHPARKPGVLSDDEYIINSSSQYQTGRRSAPIFTRRGFIASDFWNTGQTISSRTNLQDVAAFKTQVKQGAKSSGPSLRAGSVFAYQSRPHSVGPAEFLNIVPENQKESASSKQSSQGRKKKVSFSYGSTTDTKNSANRGYHSEAETAGWRQQDSSAYNKEQTTLNENRLQSSDNLSTGDIGLDEPTRDSSESGRTRGMRAVFRPPYILAPDDLQVVVKSGKETRQLNKKIYVPEKEIRYDQNFHSDSSSDESDSDESSETKKKEPSTDESDESKLKMETHTEVFARRWYLLLLFSVTAMLWNAIWSTWGPITQSSKAVYGWSDSDIAIFTYLGNIPFLITMFPCAYLMDVKGMRTAMIFCCGFMFIGAGFRCIPGDTFTSTWLIRVGQFLNGVAGTIPSSGPALLSGLWFPPNQRATATTISTVAGYMGASISFVVGPLLVPEPNNLSPVNDSNLLSLFGDDYDGNGTSNTTDYSEQEQGIKTILYSECGLAGALLVLVLIYFPSKPPLPPSISASIPREKYLNGLKLLVRNKQFWVCALAFSVPIGVYESWQVILDINLEHRGISQETAGWLDFYATVGGCVSGLLVSRFADLFTRQMKLFLLVFYSFATVAVLWFTLVVMNIIPFDKISIYAAIILAGVFLDGGSPLFFELTVEVSYPVGEGVTSGFTHMMCAAAGTFFLLVVQIETIGTDWMNWCFLGCVALTIPLLFFVNTTYGRADVDDMEIDISEDEEEAMTGIGAADSNEKTSLLKNSSV